MKWIFKNIFVLLLLIPSVYAQKNEIKEAQKKLKTGNSEQVLAILSPVEYLISNAEVDDRIHFYYLQGTALVDQANNNINRDKNLSKAILAFNDLIQVEDEANQNKFTSTALKSLHEIKENLVISANDDLNNEKYAESSNKFHQAYLIDKTDTLQLYNAAMSYKNTDDVDLTLKCFEELKSINYNGNGMFFIAYNKNTYEDEYFSTIVERDAKIQSGTHIRPSTKIFSKKGDVYKNIALIYVAKGFKEKALKIIDETKNFNGFDEALAMVEANLYLETKDYEVFDLLAGTILEINPKNAQLASDFGMSCQKELYFEGAEYYYKKAITIDPQYTDAYIYLSALWIERSNTIDSKINALGTSTTDKVNIQELKMEKEALLKNVQPYLQKAVSMQPFNANAKQLMASLSMEINSKSNAFVSGE